MTFSNENNIMIYPLREKLYIQSNFVMKDLKVSLEYLNTGRIDHYEYGDTVYEKISLPERHCKVKVCIHHQSSTFEKTISI